MCKTGGGLKLHKKKKHEYEAVPLVEDHVLDIDTIMELIMKSCHGIKEENLYPLKIIDSISLFLGELDSGVPNTFFNLIDDINKNVSFKNKESFYKDFYTHIVRNCAIYFPSLQYKTTTIITRKLAEHIYNFKSKKETNEELFTKRLSKKELAGLQYISGYVVHKLYKKLKYSKHTSDTEQEESLAILLAMKSTVTGENMQLVDALSRGGLWSVNNYAEKIFVLCEKYFCLKTHLHSRKIDLFDMVQALIGFPPILENYKVLLLSCDINISKEVAKVILYHIINLYLRFLSFSFAKDTVQRHKMAEQEKGKQASLRKGLKKAKEVVDSL